jgi:DNA polymerase elongation subunit (family B)
VKLIFDIETGPLPLAQIEQALPEFKAPENIKDPAKIEARRVEHREKAIRDAALDPQTGRILAIGFGDIIIGLNTDDEKTLLEEFWAHCEENQWFLVGFEIFQFDVPYLCRRSWITGVPVPRWVRTGRYLSDRFIDLRDIWGAGEWQPKGKLDGICRAMGIGAKNGDGAEFANLWATDREQAIKYIKNEIYMTTELAKRLGV